MLLNKALKTLLQNSNLYRLIFPSCEVLQLQHFNNKTIYDFSSSNYFGQESIWLFNTFPSPLPQNACLGCASVCSKDPSSHKVRHAHLNTVCWLNVDVDIPNILVIPNVRDTAHVLFCLNTHEYEHSCDFYCDFYYLLSFFFFFGNTL